MDSGKNSFLALRDAIASDSELRDRIVRLGKGGDVLALARDMGHQVSLDDVKPALASIASADHGTLPLGISDGNLPLKTLLARHHLLVGALNGLADRGETELDLGHGTLPLGGFGTLPLLVAFGFGVGNG